MEHTVPLKQNYEFRRLYSKGRSAVSPYFVIYCRRTGRPASRLGITTGVRLGNAVKRNRARLLPGYDIVVVARTRAIYGRHADLARCFDQQMKKLGLTAPKGDRPQ